MTKPRVWATAILIGWVAVLVVPGGLLTYSSSNGDALELCRRVACDGGPVVTGPPAIRTPVGWAGIAALACLAASAFWAKPRGDDVVLVGVLGTVALAAALLTVDEQSVLQAEYGVAGTFDNELPAIWRWLAWLGAVFTTASAWWSMRRSDRRSQP